MEYSEVITLILALWGAVLSTYLGIREVKKEKKHILIYLEHVYPAERIQMVVVNTGYRPITLTGAGVRLYMKVKGKKIPYDSIPEFSDENTCSFPVTLNDGENLTLSFSQDLLTMLISNGLLGEAFVYDVEGKLYKSNEIRYFDSRHASRQ